MITGAQVLAHTIGDYVLQSDWMAENKTKSWMPAMVHVLVYGLPFLLLRPSVLAWLVIVGTHFIIDRYRLARYISWGKNFLAPRSGRPPAFSECQSTGYSSNKPPFMAVWLMIIVDQVMHLSINAVALKYL